MNFATFQEAMVVVFRQPLLWVAVLMIVGGSFASIFILWLQLLRVMLRIAS